MTSTQGQVAVVTGAASGIGRALAIALAARRCRLALSDIDREGVLGTADACGASGAEVLWSRVDVTDRRAVARHAEQVVERYSTVHLVFNNAGIGCAAGALEQSFEDIRHVLDVNLWGVIHGSQIFLPHLIASGDGHLVNVSSLFGLLAVPTQSAYNASKFAVRGYTESLAIELAARRAPVRVSCVHPGGVATNIARSARFAASQDRDALAGLFDRIARTSPEAAARTILRGVERDRTRILVGPDARLLEPLVRFLGGRYPRTVAWATRRLLDSDDQTAAASRPSPIGNPAAAKVETAVVSSSARRSSRTKVPSSSLSQETTISSTDAT
jgi:NAD(P)-dependent dehydrogenase (short-subunit alcohol dehydrogenase family)